MALSGHPLDIRSVELGAQSVSRLKMTVFPLMKTLNFHSPAVC